MCVEFLLKFFELELPAPGIVYPAGVDAKSDLKLILEIATNSRLKQGQDKKNQSRQIFYCRSLGKDCFKIQVQFAKDSSSFKVLDDYTRMRHKQGCERNGESPNVIKIYNLMMLKRELIQNFMESNGLDQASPQAILQKISGEKGDYFYCDIVQDLQSRRKLKKRFDNIVNISIKKKKDCRLEQLDEIMPRFQKKQTSLSRGGRNKKLSKVYSEKENEKQVKKPYKKQTSRKEQNNFKSRENIIVDQFGIDYEKPKKRVKLQSNSSIFLNKASEQDEIKANNPSQIFAPVNKFDSLFHQDQEDYFKKGSDINIALNMLNEAGSHNYWPQSDNSIGQAVYMSDRMRMDDLFASRRNSLLRSLQKRSLTEIEGNTNNNININTDVGNMINGSNNTPTQ